MGFSGWAIVHISDRADIGQGVELCVTGDSIQGQGKLEKSSRATFEGKAIRLCNALLREVAG